MKRQETNLVIVDTSGAMTRLFLLMNASVQLGCISFRFYINCSETRWTFCVERKYAEIFPAVAQSKGEDHSELGLVYAVTQQQNIHQKNLKITSTSLTQEIK